MELVKASVLSSEASAASSRKGLTLIQEGGNHYCDWDEGSTGPSIIFPKVVAGGQQGNSGSRASRYHMFIIFFPGDLLSLFYFTCSVT